jgi:DNA-binding beta-propeller fold protein YncE/mono/diheme cytochrome c family protein
LSRALSAVTLLLYTSPALALTLEVAQDRPSLVGEQHTFSATASDAVGEVTYEWRFGDTGDFVVGEAAMSHAFEAPGLYSIDIAAIDSEGGSASAYFRHLVHYPLTEYRPTSSTSIVYDDTRRRVYSVNQDNDTITAIDPDAMVVVGELEVYKRPEALALTPEGKLWVVHQDDYAVAVVEPDEFVIERGFRLPYASQPVGLAISPTGDAAYVTLMATGKLLKLDPTTGEPLGEVNVGPKPRGIAVSHDGTEVYVTRFISPDAGGEVIKVDATAMTVASTIVLPLDTETVDSDQQARGLPNYLFAIGLTPDGRQAWVPGKKDNTVRGPRLDGQDLTHDTTVRPLCSIIDTTIGEELLDQRIDLDDRSMPVHVEFTPYGNLAILTLAGSNRVEIRDVNNPLQVFSAIADAGTFPRAVALGPDNKLFVQNALSRDVSVYDLTLVVETFDQGTPSQLAVIPAVANEKLSAEVLEGKKLFHNAEDTRMAFEGYISCGGCHFEGIDDGRVYDFSSRGEGLRNTLSLLGQAGTGEGRFNWTGNLDELQDFEHQIRELFDGTGFIPDETLANGTVGDPLGDTKAGLSPELDALAAYITSLATVNPSPYRDADGTLTAAGESGRAIFKSLGCDFCHAGPGFTDSDQARLHDVGTQTELSGERAREPLFGFDTPTLLGVWETPPYLHDGTAATLREVLTTSNTTDLHGYISSLSDVELDELVAYLLQIDSEAPVRRLPFEPPLPLVQEPTTPAEQTPIETPASPSAQPSSGILDETGSSDGMPTTGALGGPAPSTSDQAGGALPPFGDGAAVGAPDNGAESAGQSVSQSSGCSVSTAHGTPCPASNSALLLLGILLGARIPRRARGATAVCRATSIATLAFATLVAAACSSEGGEASPGESVPQPSVAPSSTQPQAGLSQPEAAQPNVDEWANLPPLSHPDPELDRLGSRAETLRRVCARGRADPFAKVLCEAERPAIGSMLQLLELVGLADAESRAFALTANSTSLVSKSVTGLNPRMIVFPRVESDLVPPQEMTAVGFVRGEQFVELVGRDPVTDDLNFYLLHFERQCNYDQAGCDLASLLTEEIEHDWTAYSVYDHDDLEPTSFDCLSCHQPGPEGSKLILRMQELTGPWLHWFPQRFGQRTESDRVLTTQFAEVHAHDTQYGGIPVDTIANALDEGSGAQLEALLRAEGFAEQPNPFDARITAEMNAGQSPTWAERFDAHLRGEAIAVPYPLIDVSDEVLRQAAAQSYLAVVTQAAPRESLLDNRQIFSVDAQQKLSFIPAADADGKTVLLQMCARCHDGRGDPVSNKSNFNVLRLDDMPRAKKELAISRLNATDEGRMPPWRVGTLSPAHIQAATDELMK